MSRIVTWLGRFYTGFTLSSNGYYAGGCVISVKFHWPVFTILMSISQWACFHLGSMYANNGWLCENDFEANHLKRQQIWRQFSYIFIHNNEDHLWNILYEQMLVGCCLEIINGWKPVLLVYFGGALVSDMVDFFGGSGLNGCGASGAVMALYAAYLTTIIFNWKETSAATARTSYLLYTLLALFTAPVWYPILVTILGPTYESLFDEVLDNNISHAANIGGSLGGFVFGMSLVKVFRKRLWKVRLQKKFCYVAVILLSLVIFSLFCDPLLYSNTLQNNYLGKLVALRALLSQELAKLNEITKL